MTLSDDQLRELRVLCPELAVYEEGGVSFLLLPKLAMPDGASPAAVDALLCPTSRDGYASRLFVAERVTPISSKPNWNGNIRILERNWLAASWKVQPGLRLIQMLGAHLDAFR